MHLESYAPPNILVIGSASVLSWTDHISTMAYLILSTLQCFFILVFLDYTESLGLQLPKYILGVPQVILTQWLSHWRVYQLPPPMRNMPACCSTVRA